MDGCGDAGDTNDARRLLEGALARSNNPRLGHVALAVDKLLEAYERVVNTLLGLHSRVAPNVCQEPVS